MCDIDEVPDFNGMYELYDPCTVLFFWRNKHMLCDFGTGNNNKLNWVLEDKQELIDIIETIYRGAKKGRGLVVSPKGACPPFPLSGLARLVWILFADGFLQITPRGTGISAYSRGFPVRWSPTSGALRVEMRKGVMVMAMHCTFSGFVSRISNHDFFLSHSRTTSSLANASKNRPNVA